MKTNFFLLPERLGDVRSLVELDLPLISVVVPCFNAEAFIGRTIESVLAQTYRRFELIVVDDKSSDASTQIVRFFELTDKRVRLISLQRNSGAPAAPRNAGVSAARGEWIAFLDADDLWHPSKLELQMASLRESGASMCSTGMKDFRDESDIVVIAIQSTLALKRITFRQQLLKYRTPTSSIMIKRSLMIQCPFNDDISLKAREDTDCFIRVHEFIPFSLKIDMPLVFYRQQTDQISGNKWRMIGLHLAMLKKYRLLTGAGLGLMVYVYTFTHFSYSIYLRWIRRTL